MKSVKCVLVGDGAVGKTSILTRYINPNANITEYIPTVFDNYAKNMIINEIPVSLGLWDTAGQEEYESLRSLSYPDTDVIILCFSIISWTSVENLRDKWIPELRVHCPNVPIILVGTKQDLRFDKTIIDHLMTYNQKPVGEMEGNRLKNAYECHDYIECSALNGHNIDKIFYTAGLIALNSLKNSIKKEKCHCYIL